MSSYNEIEAEAFAVEKNLPAPGRISVRIQSGLNYAISCEIEQKGTMNMQHLFSGLSHAIACMLQNVHSNAVEMGYIKDSISIKQEIAKAVLESAGRRFIDSSLDGGFVTGVVDSSKSGRA